VLNVSHNSTAVVLQRYSMNSSISRQLKMMMFKGN